MCKYWAVAALRVAKTATPTMAAMQTLAMRVMTVTLLTPHRQPVMRC